MSHGDLSGPGSGEMRKALTQIQVIAGALTFTVPLYAGMLWALTSGALGDPVHLDLPLWVGLALLLLGVLVLVLAPGLERRLMAAPAAPPSPEESGAPGRLEAEGRRAVPPPLERYRSAKIVGFAVREAAAALALVAGLLVNRPLWGYALMAAVLLAMLAAWPRAAELGSRPGDLPPGSGSVEPR